ncbi:MAG: hypothetical protein J1G01_06505 [Clostridiales bacterium]|nr:hypothetical protein [Clostridiales bacterium]
MTTKKKLLIYKILLFAFAFLIAFMPSTVSRSKEVNSRVIVELLGIDGGEKVKVTAQYVMPTETQGATSKDTVTVEGKTLSEAVEALNTALGRRAELGHCSMVIVGKDAEVELLGALMTITDVTADVYLSAAEDKACELVGEITDFMKKTGATDADFIAYGEQKAHIATNTMLGFLSDLNSASQCAYMPVVEMLKNENAEQSGGGGGGEESGQQQESGGGGGGGGDKKQQSGMKIERLALYNKEGRAGILGCCEARGVAWISAPIEKGIVTADVEYEGKTFKDVSGRLLTKHSSIKINPNNYSATLKVKAYIEPNGDKYNELGATNTKKASEALKAGFAKSIKSEIERAFNEAAKMDCDPMFIGREFYRYAPKFFKKLYSLNVIDVGISVEVVLK